MTKTKTTIHFYDGNDDGDDERYLYDKTDNENKPSSYNEDHNYCLLIENIDDDDVQNDIFLDNIYLECKQNKENMDNTYKEIEKREEEIWTHLIYDSDVLENKKCI